MSTTGKREKAFNMMIGDELPRSMLGTIIDWMRDNLNPNEVFESDSLKKFIGDTSLPEEVFEEKYLRQWAKDKGFTEPPKTETELFVENVFANIDKRV